MTLEKTVRLMLLNYPSLYSGAIEAYDQLFLTLGSGYTWENGELINTCRADNETEDVREAIKNTIDFHYFRESPGFNQYIEKTGKEDLKERLYKHRARRCGTYVTRILTVDWNIKNFEVPEKYDENIDDPFRFYPLSTLCNLYNLPDDIKPDYLEAAEILYKALLENPDKVRDDEGILGKIGEKIDRLKHP